MGMFSTKLKDVMTKDVEFVAPTASLREAADIMRRLDVGIVPVCTGGRLQGVVTDRDITIRAVAGGNDPGMMKVSEIMSRDVCTMHGDNDIKEAAELMKDKQIRRLMIVDEDEKLCGVVSLGDMAVDTGDKKMSGDVLKCVSEPAHPRS